MTREDARAIAARVWAGLFGDGRAPVLDATGMPEGRDPVVGVMGQRWVLGDALLLAALEGIEGDEDG